MASFIVEVDGDAFDAFDTVDLLEGFGERC